MKISTYELLGMVKNGKAPKKIKMGDYIYEYRGDDYMCELNDKEYWLFSDGYTKFNEWLENFLNSEVEILEEEKKIPLKVNKIIPSQNYVISDSKNNSVDERLEIIRKKLYANELYMLDLANTLNEIIDFLKAKENKYE